MGKNQHVMPHPDGGWQVKGAGNSRTTVRTTTQQEAMEKIKLTGQTAPPAMVTIREVVRRVRKDGMPVSEYAVRTWIRQGVIPVRRTGNRALLYYPRLLAFLRCEDMTQCAYLGAVNTERSVEPTVRELLPGAVVEPLPFDSYSPLTAGSRGNGIGGLKPMADGHYYGCCACIGAAGIGLVPKMALMRSPDGIVLNLYIPGTMETHSPTGKPVRLTVDTEYPKAGTVRVLVETEERSPFSIRLRNPAWSVQTEVRINGKAAQAETGYISLKRSWHSGDEILLRLDMRTQAIYPVPYGHEVLMNEVIWGENYMVLTYDEEDPAAKYHITLRRGPLVLAADSRLGYDAAGVFPIVVGDDGYVEARMPERDTAPYPHMAELEVPLENGGCFRVTDYASAGKKWDGENKIAAWIRTDKARADERQNRMETV